MTEGFDGAENGDGKRFAVGESGWHGALPEKRTCPVLCPPDIHTQGLNCYKPLCKEGFRAVAGYNPVAKAWGGFVTTWGRFTCRNGRSRS